MSKNRHVPFIVTNKFEQNLWDLHPLPSFPKLTVGLKCPYVIKGTTTVVKGRRRKKNGVH